MSDKAAKSSRAASASTSSTLPTDYASLLAWRRSELASLGPIESLAAAISAQAALPEPTHSPADVFAAGYGTHIEALLAKIVDATARSSAQGVTRGSRAMTRMQELLAANLNASLEWASHDHGVMLRQWGSALDAILAEQTVATEAQDQEGEGEEQGAGADASAAGMDDATGASAGSANGAGRRIKGGGMQSNLVLRHSSSSSSSS